LRLSISRFYVTMMYLKPEKGKYPGKGCSLLSFAHPLEDAHVLEGVVLMVANSKRAVKGGKDIEAREHMSLEWLCGDLGRGRCASFRTL